MTPEAKVKHDVKEFLISLGVDCWFYMPVPMGYERRGVKDFIGTYRGRTFGIETKAKNEKVKPWQERETAAMVAAGGVVFDFAPDYTFDDFKKDFTAILIGG